MRREQADTCGDAPRHPRSGVEHPEAKSRGKRARLRSHGWSRRSWGRWKWSPESHPLRLVAMGVRVVWRRWGLDLGDRNRAKSCWEREPRGLECRMYVRGQIRHSIPRLTNSCVVQSMNITRVRLGKIRHLTCLWSLLRIRLS
jgi:hypothetical protein